METELSEGEMIMRGMQIAEICGLKRHPDYSDAGQRGDRYITTWGTKTALGLYLTMKRLVDEGA